MHECTAHEDELTTRLIEIEQENMRLMNLYVATHQLHATLDPERVEGAIAEIALNLLGADHFALLLKRRDGRDCEVVLREGLELGAPFDQDLYVGGEPMVDAVLTDGVLWVGNIGGGGQPVAVVPLSVGGATVGALVIVRLVPHKPGFVDDDRDLLDVLATHAATALVAARLFTRTRSGESSLRGER